jgi:hypothetical protein
MTYNETNEFFIVFLQCHGASHLSALTNTGHVICHKHFLCPEILVVGVFAVIQYLLLNIHLAECFTDNRKRFVCEVIFENKHAFCSVREYAMLAPAQLSRNLRRQQRPSNKGDVDSNVMAEVGRVCYTGSITASDFIFVQQSGAD